MTTVVELTKHNQTDDIPPHDIHTSVNASGSFQVIEQRSLGELLKENGGQVCVMGNLESAAGCWVYFKGKLTRYYVDNYKKQHMITSIIAFKNGTIFTFFMENGMTIDLTVRGDLIMLRFPDFWVKYPQKWLSPLSPECVYTGAIEKL